MKRPPTPPNGQVAVSVLIPVRNEERHVRAATAAMQAQELEGELELLFVDGRSEDATREILSELAHEDPRIRILDNPARLTPQALNIALRAARGRFVARMDAHTYYPANYLQLGVERLEEGGADWVSGPQLAEGEGRWSRRVALALTTRLGTGGAAFRHTSEDEFDVDSGFTGVWRLETLLAFGGWDEGWPNDQDYELAARMRKAGSRIVCLPAMAARYVPRDSPRSLARQYHRYGVYRVKTSRRHPESMRLSHLLPPGLVATAAAAVVAPRPARRLARAGLGVYAGALAATTARALADGAGRDALFLPAVFATMHGAWGAGFWTGAWRYGPPTAAVAHVLRHAADRGRASFKGS